MNNKGAGLTPSQALDKLDELYEQAVQALRNAIGKYVENGELPDITARNNGLFVYPSLSVSWSGNATNPPRPAPMAALPMLAATPQPSPVLRCFALTLKSN